MNAGASKGTTSRMGIVRRLLRDAFGRPRGVLGRLGGWIMARNRRRAEWAAALVAARPGEHVLEIGSGPGVAVETIVRGAPGVFVAGVDPSIEMLAQARRRNARAVAEGRIDLRRAPAASLPFDDASFDAALAVNSMQEWEDPRAGLREIGRVLRPGGRIVLAFTPASGQAPQDVPPKLAAAGFGGAETRTSARGFAVVAAKPGATR